MKDLIARNMDVYLERGETEELGRLLSELHPADVAEIIERQEDETQLLVFDLLESELGSEVLVELTDATREGIISSTPVERLSELVGEMDSDDAADIVADLPDEDAAAVLEYIEPEDSADVKRLLVYDEDTAGGIMQVELVSAQEDATVQEAIDRIRESVDDVEDLNYVFVVDNKNILRGWVSLASLILAKQNVRLKDLMASCELMVNVDEDQEAVARKFKKYDARSAPVIDAEGRLLGRITVDDVFDVFHEEVDEDIYRMAGTSEAEIYDDRVLKISRLRLPWLITNLSGGLVTGYLVWLFKVALQDVLALVTFIPAIMALGGSVGIQSSTIVVRGMALGRIRKGDMKEVVFKEFRVAIVMGVICGLGGALVARLWHGSYILGLVVGLSMLFAIVFSSVFGTLTPAIFRRLNIDPALASGPFVTMCNDLLGILLYMGIATLFLKMLV